jgi:hypothetical protein
MLWLLQCLDGESSSGESPVPQIRSIGQFLLSRLSSSLNSSVLRSGFSWVSSLAWCLLHFWWMTSCTYHMPRSVCSVALETSLDFLNCIIVFVLADLSIMHLFQGLGAHTRRAQKCHHKLSHVFKYEYVACDPDVLAFRHINQQTFQINSFIQYCLVTVSVPVTNRILRMR